MPGRALPRLRAVPGGLVRQPAGQGRLVPATPSLRLGLAGRAVPAAGGAAAGAGAAGRPGAAQPAALAGLGGCILAGLGAHWAWIVAPALGAAAAVVALLGLLAVGGLWLGGASLLAARQPASAVP
ncbi:hypothetical protein ACFQU7_12960 [Pseudoroseomonas wenyumeiae]